MTHILMQIDYSEDSMFGSDRDALDGVDVEASFAKFDEMLEAKLLEEFPDADVEIVYGIGSCAVDGEKSSDDAETAEWLLHQMWETYEWDRDWETRRS